MGFGLGHWDRETEPKSVKGTGILSKKSSLEMKFGRLFYTAHSNLQLKKNFGNF